jgi:HPt (histidine-containing phosphotransfer) domain-containing protein
MDADAQIALSAALDRMWAVHLPELQGRVDVLESAAQAFAAGPLSVDRQLAAQAAAHKLAGVLGTFGLTRGTVLARELEIMYSRQDDRKSDAAERLNAIAAELRSIVSTRK